MSRHVRASLSTCGIRASTSGTKVEEDYLEATRKRTQAAERAASLAERLEAMGSEERKVHGPFTSQDVRDLEDIKPIVVDTIRAILDPFNPHP